MSSRARQIYGGDLLLLPRGCGGGKHGKVLQRECEKRIPGQQRYGEKEEKLESKSGACDSEKMVGRRVSL
jgi:hypothetical protein